MRLRHLKNVVLLLLTVIALPVLAAEMLVHGNGQGVWVALSGEAQPPEPPGEKTRIRYREFGSDGGWRELRPLSGRAVNLVSRGKSAAVLLSNGDWLLVWPGGDSVGPSIPGGGKILHLAGDKDQLLAIVQEMPAATTASATSASDDAPALAVYSFDESKWTRLERMPEDLPREGAHFSLVSVGGRLIVAVAGEGGVIRLLQLDLDNNRWIERGLVASGINPKFFELLNINGRAALWVSDDSNPAMLYEVGEESAKPLALQTHRKYAPDARRGVTFAGGNIREMILEQEQDKLRLLEQCYRPDGSPSSDLIELSVPKSQLAPVSNFPSMLLMLGLTVLILATIRRNEPEPGFEAGGQVFHLAPLHHRAAAALIDLVPILVMVAYIQWRAERGELDNEALMLPMAIAFGVYFLHTTLLELFTARTIGKWIMGMKVVTLDGSKPGIAALLVRNLLRAVDVFSPVAIMVFFTPLRQRVGDVSARTVVITTREPAAQEQTDTDDGA